MGSDLLRVTQRVGVRSGLEAHASSLFKKTKILVQVFLTLHRGTFWSRSSTVWSFRAM